MLNPEKVSLHADSAHATLGPRVFALDHERTSGPKPMLVPPARPKTQADFDLLVVIAQVDRVQKTVDALRADLERRSLEARWGRLVAWVRGQWRRFVAFAKDNPWDKE